MTVSTDNPTTYKAVRYDQFGGTDVYYLADLPLPAPASNQVRVRIKAAGVNPGESGLRQGVFANMYPSTFPSGQGSDFAGVVDAVGTGVDSVGAGDEVIGFTNDRNSHAEYILIDPDQLIPRPANVSWEQGGSLFVAGTTAYAAVDVLALKPGEVVVVSGAAGGVGSLGVQLANTRGPMSSGWQVRSTTTGYGRKA